MTHNCFLHVILICIYGLPCLIHPFPVSLVNSVKILDLCLTSFSPEKQNFAKSYIWCTCLLKGIICFSISSCHFLTFYIKTCFNVNPMSNWLSGKLTEMHPGVFLTKFWSRRKFTCLKTNELQFIMTIIFLHMNYWTS